MFENPRKSRQARNFTTNVPKILDLKSSSEQIFFRKLSLGAPDFGTRKSCWSQRCDVAGSTSKGNRSFRYKVFTIQVDVSKQTQAVKLHRTFDNLHVNRKNILGEYSSSFKPSLLNYLHLDWINLFRSDFVSKWPVAQAQNGDENYRPLILPLILYDVRSQRNQLVMPDCGIERW